MLKKTLLATATTAALLGPVAAFAAGEFGQGTITFTGSIIEAPCSISAADSALNIDLGQISRKDLVGAGKFSASVPITIHLTGCSFETDTGASANANGKLSKVGVSFAGTTSDAAKGMLTNTGNAANVAVQILGKDNATAVNFNTAPTSATAQQLTAGNTNVLNFFARLASTAATGVTAGTVSSSVTYTLTYF